MPGELSFATVCSDRMDTPNPDSTERIIASKSLNIATTSKLVRSYPFRITASSKDFCVAEPFSLQINGSPTISSISTSSESVNMPFGTTITERSENNLLYSRFGLFPFSPTKPSSPRRSQMLSATVALSDWST